MLNRANRQKTSLKYIILVIVVFLVASIGIICYLLRFLREETQQIEIKIRTKQNLPTFVEKDIPGGLIDSLQKAIDKDFSDKDICVERNKISCHLSETADLNKDGVYEFIIFPYWSCGCVRSASGNGLIYIFQQNKDNWILIGTLEGNTISPDKNRIDGFYGLITFWHLGAGSSTANYYEWENSTSSYEFKSSEETSIGI